MEDSGIDSEDKLSTINGEYNDNKIVDTKAGSEESADDDSINKYEISYLGTKDTHANSNVIFEPAQELTPQINTCRILQRKLELKVERAKRNFNQFQEESIKKTHTSALIPFSRLKIPGHSENIPLVDYQSDSEPEEISFFPVKLKHNSKSKQELSDTFSIQEMTIESDNNSDDSGSQNLELLPPRTNTKFFDIFLNCIYCKKQ